MTKPLPTEQPERGPWAWRDYLPTSMKELAELRRAAMHAADIGEISDTVADRFIGWAWAEMDGVRIRGGRTTESRYRRLLSELSPKAPPPLKSNGSRTGRRSVAAGRAKVAGGSRGRAVASIEATAARRRLRGDTGSLDVTGTAGDDAGGALEPLSLRGSGGAEVHTLRPRRGGQRVLELHTLDELAEAS